MKKKKILQITLSFALLTGIFACKSDRDDGTESQEVLKSSYSVERFKVLDITPNIAAGAKLTWSIQDSVISENTVLQFISPYQKTYPLMLKVEYNGKSTTYTSSINVIKESTTYSKYISKVFDFLPAVGQFTNELPQYTDGNSAEDMVTKAQNASAGIWFLVLIIPFRIWKAAILKFSEMPSGETMLWKNAPEAVSPGLFS